MSIIVCRMVVAAVLFGAWCAMVAMGLAEPASLLDFIKLTLAGLAAHILTKGTEKP